MEGPGTRGHDRYRVNTIHTRNVLKTMTNRTLHITIIPKPTDADLIKEIIKGAKYCNAGFDVRLVVAGYEDDPRELNEIASAVAIMQSWCRLGGLLALSVMSPAGEPFNCPDADTLGMSADIVWAASKSLGHGADCDSHEFLFAVEESNEYCDIHYTGENHWSALPKMLWDGPDALELRDGQGLQHD